MNDTLEFHSLDELRALSLDELRALWELVPTDRQRVYRAAYEGEVRAANAEGSDSGERSITLALLKRYHEAALVPVGHRWARAPQRVQTAARSGAGLDLPDNNRTAKATGPSPKLVALMGLLMVGMAGLFWSGRHANEIGTAEITATPILSSELTPTPLALDGQDSIIENGDTDRAPFYPINLQITRPNDPISRVWVVQRRAIRASEWIYDPNPDIASFLNGMSVRPIIGIPWSEDNMAWFANVGEGSEFALQMNTGAILHFTFEVKREVRRSETDLFRQVNPGLVMLLLGETDGDGLPTATRTVITAVYSVEQELERMDSLP